MYVACIYVTATLTGLYVNQVKFNYTVYGTVFLEAGLIERIHDLQIYTRCKGYLVVAGSVVTYVLCQMCCLVLQVCLAVGLEVLGVSAGETCGGMEVHIGCYGTEQVNHVVDTEVVTLDGVMLHLVERQLLYTVNGVIGVVNDIRHTVTGSAQNHSASEYAAEIGTLYGVHHTSGIQSTETGGNPV